MQKSPLLNVAGVVYQKGETSKHGSSTPAVVTKTQVNNEQPSGLNLLTFDQDLFMSNFLLSVYPQGCGCLESGFPSGNGRQLKNKPQQTWTPNTILTRLRLM